MMEIPRSRLTAPVIVILLALLGPTQARAQVPSEAAAAHLGIGSSGPIFVPMAPMPDASTPYDPARGRQLATLGDRLLRAGNVKKAEGRYQQAMRSAPELVTPRIGLAHIAFIRGEYSRAALWLHEVAVIQPGWVKGMPDVQPMFGEPAEFARHIAKLKTYIRSHPKDRDAWFVLGAEWFLTRRTVRAADIFRGLLDPKREPEVSLAAFLVACDPPIIGFSRPGGRRRYNFPSGPMSPEAFLRHAQAAAFANAPDPNDDLLPRPSPPLSLVDEGP
jgi:hypothetical protein